MKIKGRRWIVFDGHDRMELWQAGFGPGGRRARAGLAAQAQAAAWVQGRRARW